MCKLSKQIPFHCKFSVCSRQLSQATHSWFPLKALDHSVARKHHHHLSFSTSTPTSYYDFLQTHVKKLSSESWCSGTPVLTGNTAPFLQENQMPFFSPSQLDLNTASSNYKKVSVHHLTKWSNSITSRCAKKLSGYFLVCPSVSQNAALHRLGHSSSAEVPWRTGAEKV